MTKFKAGDQVRQLPDGPKMVVESQHTPAVIKPEDDIHYWCSWWAGKKRNKELFNGVTLVLIEVEGGDGNRND
ncbi:hypothetical protein UF64_00155 [Thalassospira sp. HJ]|uniref:hypothetical protein n=1 Tax=Thalassospira sp. HJ TaxID=1616823 RepID=UPI0005CF0BE8|nr:hypothetical protein [Thalassospira sp. HJ]KJE37141.1 hypothetical protein UF64_00155 [Thalassospira sp. HJ]